MKTALLKLIKVLSPSEQEPPKTEKQFITLFREFNGIEARDNNLKEKTIEKYDNFGDNLEAFLISKRLLNITASEIKPYIIEEFRQWLHANLKSCGKTHSSKHVNRCKKVMDYAVNMNQAQYNNITGLKTKRDPIKPIINLESPEFTVWKDAVWHILLFKKAQLLFTFQMTTGLSYMDLSDYTTVTDSKNRLWIESRRGKGGKPYFVPLFHEDFKPALEIHLEYNGELPYLDNGTYNRVIKEMAAILGIEKYLTTHVGRKTFATIKDQNGWALGSIAAMLGNTEVVCRDRYINVSKNKIELELLKLA